MDTWMTWTIVSIGVCVVAVSILFFFCLCGEIERRLARDLTMLEMVAIAAAMPYSAAVLFLLPSPRQESAEPRRR